MLVFYTFKLQEYKTKKAKDSQNFQHLTPSPHDFEFKTNKEERHIHSHNFNKTPLILFIFKYSCYNTKKQKKKDQIKTPLILLFFKYSCCKTKKQKRQTNQIKTTWKKIYTNENQYVQNVII